MSERLTEQQEWIPGSRAPVVLHGSWTITGVGLLSPSPSQAFPSPPISQSLASWRNSDSGGSWRKPRHRLTSSFPDGQFRLFPLDNHRIPAQLFRFYLPNINGKPWRCESGTVALTWRDVEALSRLVDHHVGLVRSIKLPVCTVDDTRPRQ